MTTTREEDTDASDVARLVRRAAEGDRWAWERLVDQYSRLIWAITRDFKLVDSDAADVAQATWLRLLEHIDRLRSPDRVGSWLAATARNECLRSLAARKKVVLGHDEEALEGVAAAAPEIDENLLAAERAQMVREALSCLPLTWQQMLELLMADPPASYAEISDQLGLPIGSIGPTRRRCLAKLRVLLQASLADSPWQETATPGGISGGGTKLGADHLPLGDLAHTSQKRSEPVIMPNTSPTKRYAALMCWSGIFRPGSVKPSPRLGRFARGRLRGRLFPLSTVNFHGLH